MARRPDTPCAGGCGQLLWGGSTSLPLGQRMCRECRAPASKGKGRARCAGTCGKWLGGGGNGTLPAGQRMCRQCRSQRRATEMPGQCIELGCDKPSHYIPGLCKTHYDKVHPARDPERRRAGWRARNHRRRVVGRAGDVTAEYEYLLRAKAKRCPMPGCNVRMIDHPYQPTSKELDHIVPVNAGGTHTIGNVRIICRLCNLRRPDDGSDYTGPVTLWAEVA